MIERGKDTQRHMESTEGFKLPYQVYYVQIHTRRIKVFSEYELEELRDNIYNAAITKLKTIFTNNQFILLFERDPLNTGTHEFYIAGSCDWLIVKDGHLLVDAIHNAVSQYTETLSTDGRQIAQCISLAEGKAIISTIFDATKMFGSTTIH